MWGEDQRRGRLFAAYDVIAVTVLCWNSSLAAAFFWTPLLGYIARHVHGPHVIRSSLALGTQLYTNMAVCVATRWLHYLGAAVPLQLF